MAIDTNVCGKTLYTNTPVLLFMHMITMLFLYPITTRGKTYYKSLGKIVHTVSMFCSRKCLLQQHDHGVFPGTLEIDATSIFAAIDVNLLEQMLRTVLSNNHNNFIIGGE